MSLILDVLKRFESKGRSAKVHPSLLKKVEESRKRVYVGLALLFLAVSALAYFLSGFVLDNLPAGGKRPLPVSRTAEPTPTHDESRSTPPEPAVKNHGATTELKTARKVEEEKVLEEKRPRRVNKASERSVKKVIEDLRLPPPRKTVKPRENFAELAYLADLYFRKGDLLRSKEYYERALELEQNPKVKRNLVVVYVRLGLYERAGALARSSGEDLAYVFLVELARRGEVERAVRDGRELLKIDRSGKVFFSLGYLYEISGDTGEALKNYRIAYEKNPSNPYFALNYARLLEAFGDYEGAYRIYESIKDLSLKPEIKILVEERLSYIRRFLR